MFPSGMPPSMIEAAKANVTKAVPVDLTAYGGVSISAGPPLLAYPDPTKLIADVLESGQVTLFIFFPNLRRVIPVPADRVQEILERLGFFRPTRETIGFRLRGFFPKRILAGFDLPGMDATPFNEFALCLRESVFDDWLARTAREQGWPLDAPRPSGRGRPPIVPSVKPIVKDIIDSGRWQQGMPLKALVIAIQSKIKDKKVDRETIKKTLDELYHETRQLTYRYARRERKVLVKRPTR
jgi:hypothetical protein